MWSEVFTHDFPSGDKIAIILLDTQGIFDETTSLRENTVIFALSMLLSSVQCYNLKERVREDYLTNLDLFTEYGRLASQQTSEKLFQYLLFIMRDWMNADEFAYGWNGQQYIDKMLMGNDRQTHEMRQLRTRIKSTFQKISGFLMPHPSMIVTGRKNFTGDLADIDCTRKSCH